jgi:uncharacterized protein YqgV (UPF0045/DUF77 family)
MSKITAHLSIYPLRQAEVTPGIGAAIDALAESGVKFETGVMGTLIWGEDGEVFRALREAFLRASTVGGTTMVVTVSSACPYPGGKK